LRKLHYMGEMKKLRSGAALILAIVAGAGCGGGTSSTVGETTGPAREYAWLKGPSRQFLVPGGDNVVQTFGEEATKKERERASRTITVWMEARAAQNWKKDCSYLSAAYKHSLVATDAYRVTNGKVKTCPEALDYFGFKASGKAYRSNLDGPIDSLRVGKGDGVQGAAYLGFAQYHGDDGRDWIVPLEREGGEWKIAKAAPLDRLH
jgi:hypothetical protein